MKVPTHMTSCPGMYKNGQSGCKSLPGMLIGVPKEIKADEYRVGMTPGSVREAVHHGHEVLVQSAAGDAIGLTDADYQRAGATVVTSADEVFARAELIVNGHNEDIQRSIDVQMGRPLHVVVTYDSDGLDGQPLLSSFVNGKRTGNLRTGIELSKLKLTRGRIGPFAGIFDEVRIYDYPLNERQVAVSFEAGPDKLKVAEEDR